MTKSAESRQVDVTQTDFLHSVWQRVLVKMRVMPRTRDRPHIYHSSYRVRLKQTNKFVESVRGMSNRHDHRRSGFLGRASFPAASNFIFPPAHRLLLSRLSADPLCMAKWSVVSLLIKYCGSSFEARTV